MSKESNGKVLIGNIDNIARTLVVKKVGTRQ